MRRFKIAGDLIAVVIPILQALPKILDLLFLILLYAERSVSAAAEGRRLHAVVRRDGLQRSAGQPAGRIDACHALLGR